MTATYRVQLSPSFRFAQVAELLPYFKDLGVSHLYLSPITEARRGSVHGYDVVDHNRVREELGGMAGFQRLREAALSHGLRLILDFVPNHAGVGLRNVAWQDVLAYGPHSIYGNYFDIDWTPLKPELQDKLLLPFLGVTYGEALDKGEIELVNRGGRIYARYFENYFALGPASYAAILAEALPRHERTAEYWDLKDLWDAYRTLRAEEREKAETLRPRLVALSQRIDFDAVLSAIQGEPLHQILEHQWWRLSYWKTAGYEINYRRFFDINELVALRMEDAEVFWDAHRLLGELLAQEGVEGVRIDHVDGLADPLSYLWRLRDLGAQQIWIEKIVATDEEIPEGWPVQGTTGYEFMADVVRVLLPPEAEPALDRIYTAALGAPLSYREEVWRSKRTVMRTSLTGELSRLAYGLDRLSEADYHSRDYTLEALREALTEIVAAFPRYRTYLPQDRAESERVIQQAIAEARERSLASEPTVFDFVERVLLGDMPPELEEARAKWVRRFQQYTAPLAAKGVEDTAFYRYHRLAALNEVGAEPDHFSITTETFHARAAKRAERFPRTLLSSATHDHKRGEDTRMRIAVLAERPQQWQETYQALSALGARYAKAGAPAAHLRYLFAQMLVALWGTDSNEALSERLVAYMQKAAHEAKLRTSWLNPDPEYDAVLDAFVRGVLHDPQLPATIAPLAAELARHGFTNGITQLVLKTTTPGVPDFYMGAELLDLSMVDPDNRRPVDFGARARLLETLRPLLQHPEADALRASFEAREERFKLYVVAKLLEVRRASPEIFAGKHSGLAARGARAQHVIAYHREAASGSLAVVALRFPAAFSESGGWEDTVVSLPPSLQRRRLTEVLSGTALEVGGTLELSKLPLPWAVLRNGV